MKRFIIAMALAIAAFATNALAALPQVVIGKGTALPARQRYCQAFNRVLSADTVYVMTGHYYVKQGFTLTIEPGTIILGHKDTGGTLIVSKGAQIFAQGTQQLPIVFTSDQAPGLRAPGDWGGIIVLGNAPVNKVNPVIEGGFIAGDCTASGATYGGANAADNSGVLSFIRIEYPGYRFQTNNEVNGLTMGGVGSGTQIDHIQVCYSDDDSYEWFGGTVNCSYLVAFGGTDDEFDTDFGFRGRVQFGFGLRDPDQSDPTGESNGFESDNDASATSTDTPYTRPIFCNITLVGPERTNADVPFPLGEHFQYSALLRRSTQTSIYNSCVMGYPWGIRLRDVHTIEWAQVDTLQVRNMTMQGTLVPNASSSGIHDEAAATGWADVDTWFATGAYDNTGNAVRNPDDILLNNLSALNNPDARPAAGSELIGTADFSNPHLSGLVSTSYRGAFPPVPGALAPGTPQDPGDPTALWTYYWTSWNPQNMDYSNGLPTGVGDGPSYGHAELSQNYPNPFNPQTSIDFTVPTTGQVTVDIFDVRGAKVATLVNSVKERGSYTVHFNANGLSSGVYFYRLKGNGFNVMKKMVLLK
jgi:Secretion system C-terminal sorting domain